MPSLTTAGIVARLERDGHGNLATAVRERRISAHSAAIRAGYFARRPTRTSNMRRLAREAEVMEGAKMTDGNGLHISPELDHIRAARLMELWNGPSQAGSL